MVRFIFSLLMVLMFHHVSSAADWSREYCTGERGVCQIYEQNGNQVDIFLQNKFPFDGIITTVTLEHAGRIENLKSHTALPLTIVCRGTERIKAATFSIVDISKQWNTRINCYWQYGYFKGVENTRHPYGLPYEKGKRFRVSQAFNDVPTHNGAFAYSIDWLMPEGTPICAARGGLVIDVVDTFSEGGFKREYLNKNNIVQILHNDGTVAQYVHMKKNGVAVKIGDRVEAGDVIAWSGNVGYSESPHLHFSVFRPIDGKKSVSMPVGFATDYFENEILEKGNIYSYTGTSTKKSRPLVDMEDVVLCRGMVDFQPVHVGTSFLPRDKFLVYVPLYAKRDHGIRINLFRENESVPARYYSWTVKKGWWQAVTDKVDLSKIPNPSGEWKAEIIIDKERIGFKNFSIKDSP